MNGLKLVFAGTPVFAATHLEALLTQTRHQVVSVYTQPDRPAGRGKKLQPSPVKSLATAHRIPVHQPPTLKTQAEWELLAAHMPDLMVVVAYGLILPPQVLTIPRLGCINVHASLLPRWRGAAPIQRAILAGDKETGITIMQMDRGLDTGPMLLKLTCPIVNDDTAASLHDRLAHLGAEAIVAALDQLSELTPVPQDETEASYAAKLTKQEAIIDWQHPAEVLDRQIRAFNPWPVAQTSVKGQTLRIWAAQPRSDDNQASPGTVIQCDKQGIDVSCGRGVLRLTQLQPAGSKSMDVAAFLNGRPDWLTPGTQLGD